MSYDFDIDYDDQQMEVKNKNQQEHLQILKLTCIYSIALAFTEHICKLGILLYFSEHCKSLNKGQM